MTIYSEVNAFLTPENWGKVTVFGSDKFCLLKAKEQIMPVAFHDPYMDDTFTETLASLIKEHYSNRVSRWGNVKDHEIVYLFNDHPDTTLEDVRFVLQQANEKDI